MIPARRRILGIGAVLPLAGCGGGSPVSTAAAATSDTAAVDVRAPTPIAPPAAPTPDDGRRVLSVDYQLHGPVARFAVMQYVTPAFWQYPGSALTAATKLFRFDFGVLPARSARLRMVWTSATDQHYARLVHADDGPSNIVEMGVIRSRGRGLDLPDNQVVDVTQAFNELRAGRVYKNIGFQLHGDGATEVAVWEARLEIVYEVKP